MGRSWNLAGTTNCEGCTAQLQLFAERCDYFGSVQRSEAGWWIMSWKSQTAARQQSDCVAKGALQSVQCLVKEISLRFSALPPTHFSLITSDRDNCRSGLVQDLMHCSVWCFDDVLARLTPLTSLKPPPVGLSCSSCGGMAFAMWPRGDRFRPQWATQVSTSVSCPHLNPQPAFLFWGSVSVHTAVMARIATKLPGNRYYHQ